MKAISNDAIITQSSDMVECEYHAGLPLPLRNKTLLAGRESSGQA